jgi:hypothetical protein
MRFEMALAHIRNGEVIRRYSGAKGWLPVDKQLAAKVAVQ